MVRQQLLWSLLVAVLAVGGLALYAMTRPPSPVYYDDPHRDWTSSPYAKNQVTHAAPPMLARDDEPAPTPAADDDHSAELRARQDLCRAAPRCAQGGFCGYEANSFGWIKSFDPKADCVALSAADCAASLRCKVIGWCSWGELAQDCYIGARDCAKAKDCIEDGLCTRRSATGVGADPHGHMCLR